MSDAQELGSRYACDLLRIAEEFLQRAAAELEKGRHRHFQVNAAAVVEHLCKAILCDVIGPMAILSDRAGFDGVLNIAGRRHLARQPNRVQTISGAEALSRCQQILPSMTPHVQVLRTIIEERNGTLHFPSEDAKLHDRAVIHFHNFLELALLALREYPDVYLHSTWKSFQPYYADARLSVADYVRSHIEGAKDRFKARLGHLDAAQLSAIGQKLQKVISHDGQDKEVECPSCGQHADLQLSPIGTPEDKEGVRVMRWVGYSQGLCCRYCNLILEGQEQVVMAGFPAEVELGLDQGDGLLDFPKDTI